ncbi:GrpB family protein [Streptomyces mirabilis]|uniref:GrpB family protein n=1 Tax=Streptomyces mirabilis TaxID=68239 RepID=UPI0040328B10
MIAVSDYAPRWSERFEELRQRLAPHVADLAVSIEHVGSTAAPGCAAKPIIDLDIVVSEEAVMSELISWRKVAWTTGIFLPAGAACGRGSCGRGSRPPRRRWWAPRG